MTGEQANQLQYIYDRFKPSGDLLINHVTFIQLGDTCTSGISIGDLILVTVGTPGGQECKINSVTGADIISNHWFSYIVIKVAGGMGHAEKNCCNCRYCEKI